MLYTFLCACSEQLQDPERDASFGCECSDSSLSDVGVGEPAFAIMSVLRARSVTRGQRPRGLGSGAETTSNTATHQKPSSSTPGPLLHSRAALLLLYSCHTTFYITHHIVSFTILLAFCDAPIFQAIPKNPRAGLPIGSRRHPAFYAPWARRRPWLSGGSSSAQHLSSKGSNPGIGGVSRSFLISLDDIIPDRIT